MKNQFFGKPCGQCASFYRDYKEDGYCTLIQDLISYVFNNNETDINLNGNKIKNLSADTTAVVAVYDDTSACSWFDFRDEL